MMGVFIIMTYETMGQMGQKISTAIKDFFFLSLRKVLINDIDICHKITGLVDHWKGEFCCSADSLRKESSAVLLVV